MVRDAIELSRAALCVVQECLDAIDVIVPRGNFVMPVIHPEMLAKPASSWLEPRASHRAELSEPSHQGLASENSRVYLNGHWNRLPCGRSHIVFQKAKRWFCRIRRVRTCRLTGTRIEVRFVCLRLAEKVKALAQSSATWRR
jgi:hypothetical protein